MDLTSLYRDIVETSPDAMWVLDLDGGTIHANAALASMYGIPVADVGGLTIFDALDEDGKAQYREHLRLVRQGISNSAEVDVLFVNREGEARWVLVQESLLRDDTGAVVATLHRLTDNDERRRLTQELERSRAELLHTQAALREEAEDSALARHLVLAAHEAESLEDAVAAYARILADHDRSEGFQAFRIGDGLRPYVGALRHPDLYGEMIGRAIETGEIQMHENGCSAAYAVGPHLPEGMVLVYEHDAPMEGRAIVDSMPITTRALERVLERQLARRDLDLALEEAGAAARQKAAFLATISHELRTPLNGIIGLNDLLLRSPLNREQRHLAGGVGSAGRHLLGVLNDILDFNAMREAQVRSDLTEVALRAFLRTVVDGVVPDGSSAVVVVCEHAVPDRLRLDMNKVGRVVGILVDNAVKFTPSGQVMLHASVAAEDVGPDSVLLRLEVRDTGVGVDSEHVPYLFDAFTQADKSHSRRFGGTGLGLAIARELATVLGGDLSYSPNPGGGSVFACTLPVSVAQRQGDPLDDYARDWLEARHLLVLDPEHFRRLEVAELLRGWGIEVTAVADEGAALAALASPPGETGFAAAIIGVTGDQDLDVVDRIAADRALDAVAMFVLSSDADIDVGRLRRAGVSVVLPRPVDHAVLRGTLLEQVGGVAAAPLEGVRGQTASRHRVLVVEDNPVNQLVAAGMLQALGYGVDVASDGAEALARWTDDTYDAVLMDVQMPVMDGYATTRALRERGVRLPVIALTAAAVDGERDRCLAAGMDDFLTKPVDAAVLDATLREWIGHPPAPTGTSASPSASAPGAVVGSTHRAVVDLPGLDLDRLDALLELDPGDTSYLDRAIANFQRNSVEALASIRQHLEAGDLVALRSVVHKIAGSALNLGVREAGALAQRTELDCEAGDADAVRERLSALETAMADGRAWLLQYQRSYAG